MTTQSSPHTEIEHLRPLPSARDQTQAGTEPHLGCASGSPGNNAKPTDRIPQETPPQPGLPSGSSSAPDLTHRPSLTKGKSILIADDDTSLRESLAAVLRSEEFEVRVAQNGRIAVREFLEGPPDLILLDLKMPDTDGWKAFEIMSRLAPYVPVIIITALPYQARRAAEAGIDMLLEKPLDIPVLLQTIRTLLAAPEKSSFAKVLRAWHTDDALSSQS